MTDADTALPHRLDRTLEIRAPRATVFGYFTDSALWASWWGAGSEIDPRPGGRVAIRYPNGIEAGGEVLEVEPPARIVFSFGFASGEPIPLGASRVTIGLEELAAGAGTRLTLRHDFAEAAVRDEHVQGWRYQLALFANAVSDRVHAGAAERVDAWFAAWSEPDATARAAELDHAVSPHVAFRDRFSAVVGRDDLEPQLEAIHRFMPGSRIARAGEVRHCQGSALADWIATGADGAESGRGTNLFRFDPDGRILEVVGFWNS